MTRLLWICAVLALAVPAAAQDLCVYGEEVHTVAGDEPGPMTICVQDGYITSVTPGDTVPAGVTRIEGAVVTPGLIESSTSLGLVEIWAVGTSRDLEAGDEDAVRAGFDVLDSLNPQSSLIPIARTGGVTTVLSSPRRGLIAGIGRWWDLSGEVVTDMVDPDHGVMWMSLRPWGFLEGNSLSSATLRLRELFADAQAYYANTDAYDAGAMRDLSISRVDLEALRPVLSGEMPVIVSADRRADILAALRLADEYGLDMTISGAAEGWAVADTLAAAGVPVIVDPLLNLPADFDALGSREDNAALMNAAGVPVIITSDEVHNIRVLRQNCGNAVRAGMPWADALEAVTLRPAEAFGMSADYGSLQAGRVADIVVWDGDPFELSTFPQHVIVRGEEVSLDNRQQALFERYR